MILPFWRLSIKIIPRAYQKTDGIIFSTDGTVFKWFSTFSSLFLLFFRYEIVDPQIQVGNKKLQNTKPKLFREFF